MITATGVRRLFLALVALAAAFTVVWWWQAVALVGIAWLTLSSIRPLRDDLASEGVGSAAAEALTCTALSAAVVTLVALFVLARPPGT